MIRTVGPQAKGVPAHREVDRRCGHRDQRKARRAYCDRDLGLGNVGVHRADVRRAPRRRMRTCACSARPEPGRVCLARYRRDPSSSTRAPPGKPRRFASSIARITALRTGSALAPSIPESGKSSPSFTTAGASAATGAIPEPHAARDAECEREYGAERAEPQSRVGSARCRRASKSSIAGCDRRVERLELAEHRNPHQEIALLAHDGRDAVALRCRSRLRGRRERSAAV